MQDGIFIFSKDWFTQRRKGATGQKKQLKIKRCTIA
jgi:hypothetical protein